jgi:predicted AAA+ superfamily ATPase
MFKRQLKLDPTLQETIFLWGPRQTGKSTLVQSLYPDVTYLDLLKNDEFIRYQTNPSLLREELLASNQKKMIIDEIQKIPELLNEVHWLIENQRAHFILCGSSARKLKREHANLLGGRALRYELFGLIAQEIGPEFSLDIALNHGYLPRHYLATNPRRMLQSYVSDYLKEEIAAEGFVRNLPVFSHFLVSASFSDTEVINYSTIARDCGISSPTVKEYFQILQDTLIGSLLPAFTKRPKRRVVSSPKFYFFDIGVVNFLNKRGHLTPGTELYGKAFENWLHHELKAHSQYTDLFYDLSYWKLDNGSEVDFILNDMEIAIECKAVQVIKSDHLKNLRILKEEQPSVKKRILVCLESKARKTEDGIDILPALEFINRLWAGEILK